MSLEHHLTDLLAMFSFAQNEILYTREREGPSGIELIFVRVPCVSSIIYVSSLVSSHLVSTLLALLWKKY